MLRINLLLILASLGGGIPDGFASGESDIPASIRGGDVETLRRGLSEDRKWLQRDDLLFLSVKHDCVDCTEVLLNHGALAFNRGNRAVLLAYYLGRPSHLEKLLKAGSDPLLTIEYFESELEKAKVILEARYLSPDHLEARYPLPDQFRRIGLFMDRTLPDERDHPWHSRYANLIKWILAVRYLFEGVSQLGRQLNGQAFEYPYNLSLKDHLECLYLLHPYQDLPSLERRFSQLNANL